MQQAKMEPSKRRTFGGNFNLIIETKRLTSFERKERSLEKKHLKAYLKGNQLYDFQPTITGGVKQTLLPTKQVLVKYVTI